MYLKTAIFALFLEATFGYGQDVQFILRTRNERNIVLSSNTINKINRTLPTIVLVPGYRAQDGLDHLEATHTKLLEKMPCNIIHLKWAKSINTIYYKKIPINEISTIGEMLCHTLLFSKIDLKSVHIIGHSIGSHIAGIAGRNIFARNGTKVARITGLDPASSKLIQGRLNNIKIGMDDADFVDVLHTDAVFGIYNSLGHVDYYPNDGIDQPGCYHWLISTIESIICSHDRAIDLFTASIEKSFEATRFEYGFFGNFVYEDDVINFGLNANSSARGTYQFYTNNSPPYHK